ncbi:MAG: hypothetical protein H7067_01320 [Burkholderiales bacterium]|nr:hypothetical protein [Opitutaceae bacterium]
MNVTLKTTLAALPLFLGYAFASAQTVLISDTFTRSGALNGSAPNTTVGGANWVALAGTNTNGTALSLPTTSTQTATIDLGTNYFSSNPGVYTLSMDVTLPSGSTTNWAAMGFVINPSTNGTLATTTSAAALNSNGGPNGGSPFMLLRQNGLTNVYRGGGTNSPLLTNAGTFVSGVSYNLKLVLDTSVTNWTLDSFVGSTQLDLNGAGVGSTAIFSTNPAALRYVALSTAGGGFGNVIIDNFNLSVAAIPEPATASLALSAAAMLGAACIRRRRQS